MRTFKSKSPRIALDFILIIKSFIPFENKIVEFIYVTKAAHILHTKTWNKKFILFTHNLFLYGSTNN